jgi:hypothetical protein
MKRIFSAIDYQPVLSHLALMNLARIHYLLDINPEYKTEETLQRLDAIFSQNSVNKPNCLYIMRDGRDVNKVYTETLATDIFNFRHANRIQKVKFMRTRSTRDVGMFIPVYPKSIRIFGGNTPHKEDGPNKQSLFYFVNNDLVKKDGKWQAPFLLRYFEWVLQAGLMPLAKELVFVYTTPKTNEI